MDDPLIGNTETVAQRFQGCTDATDVLWRKGLAGCHGDVERRQWHTCFDAYVRGGPTPGLGGNSRPPRRMYPPHLSVD